MGPESCPQEPAEVTHVNTEDTGVAMGQKRARPDHVEDEKESQKRLRRNEGEVSKTAGRNKFNKSRSERRNQGQWDTRNKEGGDQDKIGRAARVEGEDGDRGEARRPKKKVAVLIGYAGTGYKGMQMTKDEKTIEADLFAGFCAAGAISKVNADDPKKSSFVRCARTDKGVHAAGNVVSLKLIVEDKDIVQKINAELPDQIRVWSIVPTVGSFSCYTQCDSRIYEYLIPSYCLLPPDPKSSLAETLVEAATSENDLESYLERRSGNEDFWSTLESEQLQPYLQTLEPAVRESLLAGRGSELSAEALLNFKDEQHYAHHGGATEPEEVEPGPQSTLVMKIKAAHSHLRSLTLSSKRHCRIAFSRLTRLRDVLAPYVGSRRFHNYTIRVSSNDPSAVRTIKSFTASEPFLIGETEWISLKVHGQSFMMHQIRKMVAMAVLMVRCGTPIDLIRDTTMKNSLAIPVPKAPALGLLLERPVFDTYSKKAVEMHEREAIDFDKYEDTIKEFKQRQIYNRIYEEEEKSGIFDGFFGYIDGFQAEDFDYLTSRGLKGYQSVKKQRVMLRRTEAPNDEPPLHRGAAAEIVETEVGSTADAAKPLGTGVRTETELSKDRVWSSDDEDAGMVGDGENG